MRTFPPPTLMRGSMDVRRIERPDYYRDMNDQAAVIHGRIAVRFCLPLHETATINGCELAFVR